MPLALDGNRPRSILVQIVLQVWGAAGQRHKFGPSLQVKVSASLGAWCPLSTSITPIYEYNRPT